MKMTRMATHSIFLFTNNHHEFKLPTITPSCNSLRKEVGIIGNLWKETAAKHQYHYIIVEQRLILSINKCIQNAEMTVMLVAAA